MVGLFPGKAVLVINGAAPRTLAIGEHLNGVRLLSCDASAALLEVDGKRRSVAMGEQVFASASSGDAPALTHLTADARGHFVTMGSVNGVNIRFLVDTGATIVSLGASDAVRAGIAFRQGTPSKTMTANGVASVWLVKLSSVRVGEMTLHDVDAAVHEQDLPVALLGMSFLNRLEMHRDGDTLTLKKRF